jgi:hypothetical protein
VVVEGDASATITQVTYDNTSAALSALIDLEFESALALVASNPAYYTIGRRALHYH